MLLQNVHNFVDVQHPNCTSMHTASFDSNNCVFFYTCMFMLKQVYFLAAAAGGWRQLHFLTAQCMLEVS